MSHPNTSEESRLREALERLYQFHPLKIDLSLGRLRRLLTILANPEQKLPPVIHVAGTNGKGSVVANLRAILEAAGLKVHIYTSPHLVSFRERIRLAGKLIGADRLIEILERVEAANKGQPITFFEVTTAAALLAFSETPADICLLEVGLGGRLDATNVIEKPLVTVITPVDLDHAEFLGKDLKKIALEKAGIAKPGVPLVVARQKPEALAAIEDHAENIGAPLLLEGRDWKLTDSKFSGFAKQFPLPRLALAGDHQIHNAALALAVLFAQNTFQISEKNVLEGLQKTTWPARFQKLPAGDFSSGLSEATDIWLDGGHNPLAGQMLARLLPKVLDKTRPRFLVGGMMEGKDAAGFLKPIARFFDHFYAVPVPGKDKCANPETLCRIAEDLGLEASPARDVPGALETISGEPGLAPQILITGSLYLAGHVLAGIKYPVK